MPERVKGFGYDLDAAVSETKSPVVMVDVGGGKGEMLFGGQESLPISTTRQSHPGRRLCRHRGHPGVDSNGLELQSETPQPLVEALNYSLTSSTTYRT